MKSNDDILNCEECGKEDHILFTVNNHRGGTEIWVCESCFCKIHGVSFEDYGVKHVN